jgi:hypothetical protein
VGFNVATHVTQARPTPACHTSENVEGESDMAVLIEDVFPAEITIELLDAVTDDMGVDFTMPPGGFMHLHFEKDGWAHGVDVWDSLEAYQLFVQSTLMPALEKRAAERGIDLSQSGEPEATVTEIHRLVR